jgi:DNA polymerase-3 subunit epsilon
VSAIAEWAVGRVHGFDLETTGVDPEEDRVVTGTFLTVNLGSPGDDGKPQVSATSWLANPGKPSHPKAIETHKITDEHAAEHGEAPEVVVGEMLDHLVAAWEQQEPVVIYNAPFDLTMLDREARRHLGANSIAVGPVVDPLVLDKKINKFVKGTGQRKLINTCKRWGVVLTDEDAHTAEGDTLASCRLAWKMAHTPLLAYVSLGELQRLQREWYRLQSLDFAGWLDKKDRGEDAKRVREEAEGWPVRPLPTPIESDQDKVPF